MAEEVFILLVPEGRRALRHDCDLSTIRPLAKRGILQSTYKETGTSQKNTYDTCCIAFRIAYIGLENKIDLLCAGGTDRPPARTARHTGGGYGLDAPTSPGKTLPAGDLIDALQRDVVVSNPPFCGGEPDNETCGLN